DLATQLQRPSPRELQHLGTDVDAGEPGVGAVQGQVQTGADADLQHISRRPGAHPRARAGEESAIDPIDLPVVLRREARVEAPDARQLRSIGWAIGHLREPWAGLPSATPATRPPAERRRSRRPEGWTAP